MNEANATNFLVFFSDPMCSWCYGISKEIDAVRRHYEGNLEWLMVMGGLKPTSEGQWDEDMKKMLRQHWETVEKETGQEFNYNLLSLNQFDYNTEPSCRAVRVVRDMAPDKEFEFFEAIQHAFYVDNDDPKNTEVYQPICRELDIDYWVFSQRFASTTYKDLVRKDFIRSQELGVKGFPTLALGINRKLELITHGYATAREMKAKINDILYTQMN